MVEIYLGYMIIVFRIFRTLLTFISQGEGRIASSSTTTV